MTPKGLQNVSRTVQRVTNDLLLIQRAHEAVHPEVGACAIGSCRLQQTEEEAERLLIDRLRYASQHGLTLTITAENGEAP